MEGSHTCENCGKSFSTEGYLKKHKNSKSCHRNNDCPKCGKTFTTPSNLRHHLNRKNPCVPDTVPVVEDGKITCKYCGNDYSTKFNLRRHMKTCGIKEKPELLIQLVAQQQKQLQQMSEKQDKLMEMISKSGINLTNIDNSTNIQNNMYVNVALCCFGQEDLTKLDKNKVLELVRNHEKDFISKMIDHIHANPNIPEFHNVVFDSESKNAIVFAQVSSNKKSWEQRDFLTVSKELTKKIQKCMHPLNGPYFNHVLQENDSDTANPIIRIADQTDWDKPEVHEQNKGVLSKIQHNKGFAELLNM